MEIIRVENVGIKLQNYAKRSKSTKSALLSYLRGSQTKETSFWALKDISFSVEKGTVLGVIGKNGSGKSTLLRVVGGIFTADEGRVYVNGSVSTILSITTGFQQALSGLENIYLVGVLMGFSESEIGRAVDEIVEFSELGNFIDSPVKIYSSGMSARLGFSIAMTLSRDIMLIDEILSVGDLKFREKCMQKTREIMKQNKTVILVSHSMDTIKNFAHKAAWLDKGRLLAFGSPQDVIDKYYQAQAAK